MKVFSNGIGFCFDLATALYVYAMENADYEEEYIIRHALSSKPVEFRQSPIFSNIDFLAVDADAEYGDYTTSKMIYDDMVENPKNAKEYLDALVWYCREADKRKIQAEREKCRYLRDRRFNELTIAFDNFTGSVNASNDIDIRNDFGNDAFSYACAQFYDAIQAYRVKNNIDRGIE